MKGTLSISHDPPDLFAAELVGELSGPLSSGCKKLTKKSGTEETGDSKGHDFEEGPKVVGTEALLFLIA
jgi:hypothetical protein